MVNQDATSLTQRTGPLYFKLLDRAYCGTS
jgi:hypothetical protein